MSVLPADPTTSNQRQLRFSLLLVTIAVVLAFIPTGITLAKGPWQSDQDAHGPFIIAACCWIVWNLRDRLAAATFRPAPILGWTGLIGGLFLLVIGRSQDILSVEVFSLLPILGGTVLLMAGWRVLLILFFPLVILFFAVPPPGWVLDTLTLPLKSSISDAVTRIFYNLGYPIAQNGVVIMIGGYQLLVKDACAGLNSIFALLAIGFIYVYLMGHGSVLRNALLMAAILPITIIVNFLRVAALVYIAYNFGTVVVDGVFHDVTGFALFFVAFILMLVADGIIGFFFVAASRLSSGGKRAIADPVLVAETSDGLKR